MTRCLARIPLGAAVLLAAVLCASPARAQEACVGFDDPTLVPGMVVKAAHVQQLRACIDAKRTTHGLTAFVWTDQPVHGGTTPVKAVHITQMRLALIQAYAKAGVTPPSFAESIGPMITPIRASHIVELRAAAVSLMCGVTATMNTGVLPHGGGTASFTVTTLPGCAWTVSYSAPMFNPGFTGGTGSQTFPVDVSPNTARLARSAPVTIGGGALTVTQRGIPAVATDFDGDGQSDIVTWDAGASPAVWHIWRSNTDFTQQWQVPYGRKADGDVPLAADFDGDGRSELVVWHRGAFMAQALDTNGAPIGPAMTYAWGRPDLNDTPVLGDYDGDGRTDAALWRPSTGQWTMRLSGPGPTRWISATLGAQGDIPMPADYDGDGVTDIAVWRKSVTPWRWVVRTAASNFTTGADRDWGSSTESPTVGDYTGDGRVDAALWLPYAESWRVRSGLSLSDNDWTPVTWSGISGAALGGDFDGDGRSDMALRRDDGAWVIRTSSSGFGTPVVYPVGPPEEWAISDAPPHAPDNTTNCSNLTVTPSTAWFAPAGGEARFDVTAPPTCFWSAVPDQPWVTASGLAVREGNGSVTVAGDRATETAARSALLRIAGMTVPLTQEALCVAALSAAPASVPAGGGSGTIQVSAVNSTCAWTPTSAQSWVTVGSGGTGSGTTTYGISANLSHLARTAVVTINGRHVSIVQAGVPCTFSVTPAPTTVTHAEGSTAFTVQTPTGCSWTAGSPAAWMSLSPSAGVDGGFVIATHAKNTAITARTVQLTIAGQAVTVTQQARPYFPPNDFDGDKKSDLVSWGAPTSGPDSVFRIKKSTTGEVIEVATGRRAEGDIPLSGDFNHDGFTDLVIWSHGDFYVMWNTNGSFLGSQERHGWGEVGDEPVLGDYDGDGETDLAVWRRSQGLWAIQLSGSNNTRWKHIAFGSQTDIPVPADYDGDGKTDLGIRTTTDTGTNKWAIRTAATGFTDGPMVTWPGGPRPLIAGDYDGDGRADAGFWDWEVEKWFVRLGPTLAAASQQELSWDETGTPVGGDYDGDGRFDRALWHLGAWHIRKSSENFAITPPVTLGLWNDIPVSQSRAAVPDPPQTCTTATSVTATSVSPSPLSVDSAGGVFPVTVTAAHGCHWSISSDADWVTVSGLTYPEGWSQDPTTDSTVNVTIAPHSGIGRIANLGVSGRLIQVRQGLAGCDWEVQPSTNWVTSVAGIVDIDIVTGANCTWEVPGSGTNLQLTAGSPSSGQGTATVSYSYTASPDIHQRLLQVEVMGQAVVIVQIPAEDDVPPGVICTYATNPPSSQILTSDSNGGQFLYVEVTTNDARCPWSAKSLDSGMMTVSAFANARGSHTFEILMKNNPSQSPRSGFVRFAGLNTEKMFQVNQGGTCTFNAELREGDGVVEPGGDVGHVDVVASHPTCAWTAESLDSFIVIAEPILQGSRAAEFEVGPNGTGQTRTGVIRVAGKAFTITQTGLGNLPDPGGEVSYFHTDAIGSVRLVTDAAGNEVVRYDYQPFGSEALNSDPNADNRIKFAGKERDKESQFGGWQAFDYFGARYFQSQTGRFTTVDPVVPFEDGLVNPQRWNRYAYALNNPLRYLDPDGRYSVDCGDYTEEECKILKAEFEKARLEALERNGDIKRAAQAYGTLDDGNNVVVRFSALDSETGGITNWANAKGKAAEGAFDHWIIDINGSSKGNDFKRAVVHEGSHLADGQRWERAGFDIKLLPTVLKTEVRAYQAGQLITPYKQFDYKSVPVGHINYWFRGTHKKGFYEAGAWSPPR